MQQRVTNFFITGEKRSGKSTILNCIISDPFFSQYRILGYRTKSIIEHQDVIGFQLEVLNGNTQHFAHISLPAAQKFDRYYVDPSVFDDLGLMALTDARENADIILIDEVGVIEKKAQHWKSVVIDCLNSPKIVIGIFQKRAHWFSEILEARNDTQIFDISILNKNGIDLEILAQVKRICDIRKIA